MAEPLRESVERVLISEAAVHSCGLSRYHKLTDKFVDHQVARLLSSRKNTPRRPLEAQITGYLFLTNLA